MKWIDNGAKNVLDAVNKKTGRGYQFIDPDPGIYTVPNLYDLSEKLITYVENNVPITIIGDYDADGICATAGLFLLLRQLNAESICIRIPKRMSEGYGLSPKIISEINEGVIITVDNGITAIDAIKIAKEKGLDVMILDHHQPIIDKGKMILPEADIIVDPHVDQMIAISGNCKKPDFDGYCGAGLVYKLAELLIPKTETFDHIAAFSAIATIADVVPLIEDNRNIYHHGIRSIRRRIITPGLQAIVNLLQSDNQVTEKDIGFRIAPMLNAPGRLYDDGAMLSLRTLLSESAFQASTMAMQLRQINEKRKAICNDAVIRANDYIKLHQLEGRNPMIIYDPDTPEGIVGLVAGNISEQYNVSAIVFTKVPSGIKGSARASDYDNIKDSLVKFHDCYPDVPIKYGGHKGAAGLSIAESDFDIFSQRMQDIMSEAKNKNDHIEFDLQTEPLGVVELASEIDMFSPFGEGNPSIIVKIRNFKVVPKGGKFFQEYDNGTIRFFGAGCEAIGFSMAERIKNDKYPKQLDIVGILSFRYYNGSTTVQIEMLDYKPIIESKKVLPVNQSIINTLKQIDLF